MLTDIIEEEFDIQIDTISKMTAKANSFHRKKSVEVSFDSNSLSINFSLMSRSNISFMISVLFIVSTNFRSEKIPDFRIHQHGIQ